MASSGASDGAESAREPTPGTGKAPAARVPTTRPSVRRPSSVRAGQLPGAIESVIAKAVAGASKASKGKLKRGQVVVAVAAQDLKTGKVLIDRLGDRPMIPASNLKVMTAGAALLGLGLDAQFETKFEAGGDIAAGKLDGPLVVRAGADPMHIREGDGSLDRWLNPLADALKAAGIKSVKGPLVLDATGFEKPGPPPLWPAPSAHWQAYCALSGGFTANGGVFRVTVSPHGGKANEVLRPRYHGLERKGSVSVKGKKNSLRVGANTASVTVGGSVPAKMDTYVTEFRHPSPTQLFAESILGGLEARGIRFDDRRVAEGTVGSDQTRLVYTMRSPVTSILEAVLLDSNNPVTDQLFLLVGHRLGGGGTRERAASAVRRVLGKAGVNVEYLQQADGSGLSKANRVTAMSLVQTLSALARSPQEMREAWVSSLPIAGKRGGLKARMRGTAAEGVVAAKTGWVAGASSLSGYVLTESGDPAIAFSILVGYPRLGGLNTSAWKPMQDKICALLAEEVAAAERAAVVR